LIKARAANPDVMILLVQGSDMINCLKQVVQFGLNKQIHVAGTQQELESLAALPPEARIGVWMFEWYWKQPGVPGVEKFVADIRKVNSGNVPTARHWFAMLRRCPSPWLRTGRKPSTRSSLRQRWRISSCRRRQAAAQQVLLRKGDHQLMTSAFVGEAQIERARTIRRISIASTRSCRVTRPLPPSMRQAAKFSGRRNIKSVICLIRGDTPGSRLCLPAGEL